MNAPLWKPKGLLGSSRPEGEISHPGFAREPDLRKTGQRGRNGGQIMRQGCCGRSRSYSAYSSASSRRAVSSIRGRFRDDRPIGKVGTFRQMVNAIQNHRPREIEDHFLGIRVEFAGGKSTSGGQPANASDSHGGMPDKLS